MSIRLPAPKQTQAVEAAMNAKGQDEILNSELMLILRCMIAAKFLD